MLTEYLSNEVSESKLHVFLQYGGGAIHIRAG